MQLSTKVKKEYSSTFSSTFPYAFIACIKTSRGKFQNFVFFLYVYQKPVMKDKV
jgi:hypothetical protein